MFSTLPKSRKKAELLLSITVQLNAKLQPMHRGTWFEDPLDKFLSEKSFGSTTGGGSLLSENGEIVNCDIEADLAVPDEYRLAEIIGVMENMGAPKGSFLIRHDTGTKIPFGVAEGLGIYLNGTELPQEVYDTCDISDMYEILESLIEEDGRILSYWEGAEETALYLYGPSFFVMSEKIAAFVAEYPLCRKCRIVQIA